MRNTTITESQPTADVGKELQGIIGAIPEPDKMGLSEFDLGLLLMWTRERLQALLPKIKPVILEVTRRAEVVQELEGAGLIERDHAQEFTSLHLAVYVNEDGGVIIDPSWITNFEGKGELSELDTALRLVLDRLVPDWRSAQLIRLED